MYTTFLSTLIVYYFINTLLLYLYTDKTWILLKKRELLKDFYK